MIDGVKCVIFDNDGTVADTRNIILPSMRYATDKILGKVWSDEFYSSLVGIPLQDQVGRFTDDPEKQQALIKCYRDYNERYHDDLIEKFAGCKEALTKMKGAGLTLAVATSKMRTICTRGLNILGVFDLMSTVVGVEDTEKHKPHGDPIVFTAQKLGFDVSQCAYVGDAPFDMQAAKDAKVTAIGVTWGFFAEDILLENGADYICHSFDELANLLI